jgi:hypothetical protein
MAALPLVREDGRAGHISLLCSVCGYGIALETPPGPCPMCRSDDAWIRSSRRPFTPGGGGRRGPAGGAL